MHILSTLVVLGAAVAVGNCAVAAPAAIAAPRIFSATFSGNGCPTSGTKPTLSGGSNSLVVSMPDFAVQLGGGASAMNRMANCEVHLNIDQGIPRYKLAVKTITAEGYMFASPNVSMSTYATVFWSQDAANTYTEQTDVAADAQATTLKQVSIQTMVPGAMASKCLSADNQDIGILNINFRAFLGAEADGAVGAFVGMDGHPITETIEFAWEPCEPEEVEIEVPGDDEDEMPEDDKC